MRAVVPLNIAVLRVSREDSEAVAPWFKGRTAVFEDMPWTGATGPADRASTGDWIVQPLERADSPASVLGTGVHLHWQLPDHFRRGAQSDAQSGVVFPPAPNRWLVIRYLRVHDGATGGYGAPTTKSWIVESDHVHAGPPTGTPIIRPSVAAPLPVAVGRDEQPYRLLGRALDAEDWDPRSESPADFLPGYRNADGAPLHLTAIGFVGPSFCAYYPECASVFGFWDHFGDAGAVHDAITNGDPLRFKVSYQVVGWFQDGADDPMSGIARRVREEYDGYVAQRLAGNLAIENTPADVFVRIVADALKWDVRAASIGYALKPDKTLDRLTAPDGVLCAGLAQEIVWDAQTPSFLSNPSPGPASRPQDDPGLAKAQWIADARVCVGATTIEALSALLKQDLKSASSEAGVLDDYELLLDALQLGLLKGAAQNEGLLVGLEERIHARSFAKFTGGHVWTLQNQTVSAGDREGPGDGAIRPPPTLVGALGALNRAQKAYDQARAALDVERKQLFMDWLRFVKIYTAASAGSGDDDRAQALWDFVAASSGESELTTVVEAGRRAGTLSFQRDRASGEIVGLAQPAAGDTAAQKVWANYQAAQAAIAVENERLEIRRRETKRLEGAAWRLRAAPAEPFWTPSDPVLLVEGDRLAPTPRGGRDGRIAVRTSAETLTRLAITVDGATAVIDAASLEGRPYLPAAASQEVAALVDEAFLLVPMLAEAAADALAKRRGNSDPAERSGFAEALRAVRGGSSPLDGGGAPGLYEAVRRADPGVGPNPALTPPPSLPALEVVFTNAAGTGWPPDPLAWTAQTRLAAFGPDRVDPFLPTFLVWRVTLDPLRRDAGRDYSAANLTEHFQFDGVDYRPPDRGPPSFTLGTPVSYGGSVFLSRRATASLSHQIESYLADAPDDPAAAVLRRAKAAFEGRNILSQALSGFNAAQTLRWYIPQIPVQNLVAGPRDEVTTQIRDAASADPQDLWREGRFNSVAPISGGLLALDNFGPLRSGVLRLETLEIVDAFGQRMRLETSPAAADGSPVAAVTRAMTLDPAEPGAMFLAPRILAPTRLAFSWRSALRGMDGAPLETSARPATTPALGWILPDHLDASLFFYDAEGAAIGSLGLSRDRVVYRTRAGNAANPSDLLAADIGAVGAPSVDPNLAAFMWRIAEAGPDFLRDLLEAIEATEASTQPAGFAQDQSLAALIGRPLALARAEIGLETAGALTPISQADAKPDDPFPQDVAAGRFSYELRQSISGAALDRVIFPVELGELAHIDDGLVGFLVEAPGGQPYRDFFCEAAKGGNGVEPPKPDTLRLTLNAEPVAVTLLLDPRAPVHARCGVLPIVLLQIPPDRYVGVLRRLAATFFTHPVLARRQGLVVPLPREAGYAWSWVQPGDENAVPLAPHAADGVAAYDYTPQRLLEGWLRLLPESDGGPAASR